MIMAGPDNVDPLRNRRMAGDHRRRFYLHQSPPGRGGDRRFHKASRGSPRSGSHRLRSAVFIQRIRARRRVDFCPGTNSRPGVRRLHADAGGLLQRCPSEGGLGNRHHGQPQSGSLQRIQNQGRPGTLCSAGSDAGDRSVSNCSGRGPVPARNRMTSRARPRGTCPLQTFDDRRAYERYLQAAAWTGKSSGGTTVASFLTICTAWARESRNGS